MIPNVKCSFLSSILAVFLSAVIAAEVPGEPLPVCSRAALDLVIAVDSSSSVGSQNFVKTQDFVLDLIQQLPVQDDAVRVGLVRYSTNADIISYLDEDMDRTAKLMAVRNMRYRPGLTSTHKALMATKNSVLSTASGNRELVPDLVILTTDGVSVIEALTAGQATSLKKMPNLQVAVVAIGRSVSEKELLAIASSPDLIYRTSFPKLADIVGKMTTLACSKSIPKPLAPDDISMSPSLTLTTTTSASDVIISPSPVSELSMTSEVKDKQSTTTSQPSNTAVELKLFGEGVSITSKLSPSSSATLSTSYSTFSSSSSVQMSTSFSFSTADPVFATSRVTQVGSNTFRSSPASALLSSSSTVLSPSSSSVLSSSPLESLLFTSQIYADLSSEATRQKSPSFVFATSGVQSSTVVPFTYVAPDPKAVTGPSSIHDTTSSSSTPMTDPPSFVLVTPTPVIVTPSSVVRQAPFFTNNPVLPIAQTPETPLKPPALLQPVAVLNQVTEPTPVIGEAVTTVSRMFYQETTTQTLKAPPEDADETSSQDEYIFIAAGTAGAFMLTAAACCLIIFLCRRRPKEFRARSEAR